MCSNIWLLDSKRPIWFVDNMKLLFTGQLFATALVNFLDCDMRSGSYKHNTNYPKHIRNSLSTSVTHLQLDQNTLTQNSFNAVAVCIADLVSSQTGSFTTCALILKKSVLTCLFAINTYSTKYLVRACLQLTKVSHFTGNRVLQFIQIIGILLKSFN